MSLWSELAESARELVASGSLDQVENQYKLEQGRSLASVRDSFLSGEDGWLESLEKGLGSNLLHYINRDKLIRWIQEEPSQASAALRSIWVDDVSGGEARIRAFCQLLPSQVIGGLGSRTNLASVLLMAIDTENYPPFRIRVFQRAYGAFGFGAPSGNLDEAGIYGYALAFLDALMRDADASDIRVRHRLDAQSLVWALLGDSGAKSTNPSASRENSGNKPVWLMALGPGSQHWDSCHSGGIAAIGWDDLGDLGSYQSREDIAAMGLKVHDSLACWQFSRGMQLGDVILVRGGRNHIVGAGLVTSDYRFEASRSEFRHVRDVDWKVRTEPRTFRSDGRLLPVKTLTNVSDYEYSADAKSILGWNWDKPPAPPAKPASIDVLADNLHLPDASFLERIIVLLRDKKQVIFQGPPGTGKTFIAIEVAKYWAGSDDRVTLVQFHPSYAYEDFIQGYRPCILTSGRPGFELRDGPLLAAAQRARDNPDTPHVLVIDEINRGNLAKVFGELYFLLEYRDRPVRMQYQDSDRDGFTLPDNLYIIGTMNTADRSIALVDAALRRRFYFVEFHPDEEPVRGVLRRWVGRNAPDVAWLADAVERANELLADDRHAAIGPSYFMKKGLGESAVRRIWRHSVLPYIEERLFGEHERLREFELGRLRRAGSARASNEQDTDQAGVG
ncbi:MAG: AAA domain-containing protein [Chloroflexi bacterium]|nr:AAA domain-containing protein [Chloroflexota bacterium]